MRILLSNDDGYQSPGLLILAQMLASHGRVTIVAPDRDRSGSSNSLTLNVPLVNIRSTLPHENQRVRISRKRGCRG